MRQHWEASELAYCSNVHTANSVNSLQYNVLNYAQPVRAQRQLKEMSLGLWISETVAQQCTDGDMLEGLIDCLKSARISIPTLNGFPQKDFHQSVVKHKVYLPTWAEKSRLDYSVAIAQILAKLLDQKNVGTISTLPLAYKLSWSAQLNAEACRNLCLFVKEMEKLEEVTGKQIRLCLEMEPGCVLESTQDVIRLFCEDLPSHAYTESVSQRLIDRYLGVCYDVCHQAVMHEDISASINALANENITIGKVQVSSAMRVLDPADPTVKNTLNQYAEPKYMHQVMTKSASDEYYFSNDLIEALADPVYPQSNPWYVHFHLPIHTTVTRQEGIATTQAAILDMLDAIQCLPYKPQLEVETYTWDVLPESARPKGNEGLISGLCQELSWLEKTLLEKGLLSSNSSNLQ